MKKRGGFTLIELLMVIGIISILAVISMSTFKDTTDEARFETTRARMIEIRNALVGDPSLKTGTHRNSFGYLGDLGAIPTALQGLTALLTNPSLPAWALNASTRFGLGWNGPYLNSTFSRIDYTKDAWGTAFAYSPGTHPATLISYGADRVAGGTEFNQDLTIQIPDALLTSTVHGVLLAGGVQWPGTAEVEFNYPSGTGTLSQSLIGVAPADLGAFSASPVPLGVRSATVYVPAKLGATSTLGPYIITVDQADALAPINIAALSSSNVLGHSFTSPCGTAVGGSDQFAVIKFDSSGGTGQVVYTMYDSADGSCTLDSSAILMNFNHLTLGPIDPSSGRFDLGITAVDIFITPSSGEAGYFNSVSECGVNTWTAGVATNISGLTCTDLTGLPTAGEIEYASQWITGTPGIGTLTLTQDSSGDTVGCGANDNTSPAKRCTVKGTEAGDVLPESL